VSAGTTTLEQVVAHWAATRLGFDARALRLERILGVARAELARLGSLEALENALLNGERQAEDALVIAATVGETYFFRQHEHFDLLSEMKAPADGRFMAWSAGCSSGEEAYSLAGALRQRFGFESPALTVWATDINPKALEAARRADYGRWSWRQGEDAGEQARRALALDERSKACVRFAQHNLLAPPLFDGLQGERFDLIFCRNVLVYFSPINAERAVAHLRGALKPGGWLVLGNMDLGGQPRGFKRVGPAALCVYAKSPASRVEPAEAAGAPAPAPAQSPAPLKPKPVKLQPEPLDPVDWHSAVLAEIETGHSAQALQELQLLVEHMPDYLPGLFEHALALRRVGKAEAAAESLRRLLRAAEGRDLSAVLRAPEPLSLEFYVNSARSFLDSLGDRP
jgi:chemotaxis protein methyltransferase CheR